jgi:uncharacterized protein YbaR (Trm112 family)
MTYSCTNSACGWRGPNEEYGLEEHDTIDGELVIPYALPVCPECHSPVEDLDYLERAAIREYDGGDNLICETCGNHESAPYDVEDECCCGGRFYEFCELVPRKDAERLAKEDLEKWRGES